MDRDLVNTKEVVRPVSWFLRGLEEVVRVGNSYLRDFKTNEKFLVSLQSLGFQEPIRDVASVRSYDHVYYVSSEDPNKIFASFLPNPLQNAARAQRMFLSHQKLRPKLMTMTQVEVDGEILKLASTNDALFALSISRDRDSRSRVFQVHRFELDPNIGFLPGGFSATSELSDVKSDQDVIEDLQFEVAKTGVDKYALFFSGFDDSSLLSTTFSPNTLLRLRRVDIPHEISEQNDLGPYRIHVPAARRKKRGPEWLSSVSDIRMLVARRRGAQILEMSTKREGTQAEISKGSLPHGAASIDSIGTLSTSTRDFQIDLEPKNLSSELVVYASAEKQRIWTISHDDRRLVLPLIGGGNIPHAKVAQNLLQLDIGRCSKVCVHANSCIMFGHSDRSGWLMLSLPQMVKVLSPEMPLVKKDADVANQPFYDS